MMFSMRLQQRCRQIIECGLCGGNIGDWEEHHEAHPECPHAKIGKLLAERKQYGCPVCPGRSTVDLNVGDFFECRQCRTQFSASDIVIGGDTGIAKPAFLIDADLAAIPVHVMKQKGDGVFRSDQILDSLKAELKRRKRQVQAGTSNKEDAV